DDFRERREVMFHRLADVLTFVDDDARAGQNHGEATDEQHHQHQLPVDREISPPAHLGSPPPLPVTSRASRSPRELIFRRASSAAPTLPSIPSLLSAPRKLMMPPLSVNSPTSPIVSTLVSLSMPRSCFRRFRSEALMKSR